MKLQNYTTKIKHSQSLTEIMQMLALAKAKNINITYDDDSKPDGISFNLQANDLLFFQLPCNYLKVYAKLKAQNIAPVLKTKEHALDVSWRIVKDWLKSQLTLIEINLAETEEIFMPYMLTQSGKTLFKELQSNNFKLLQ